MSLPHFIPISYERPTIDYKALYKCVVADIINDDEKRQYDSIYIRIDSLTSNNISSSLDLSFYSIDDYNKFMNAINISSPQSYFERMQNSTLRKKTEFCFNFSINFDNTKLHFKSAMLRSISPNLDYDDNPYMTHIELSFEYFNHDIVDIEKEVVNEMQNQITQEINKKIVNKLLEGYTNEDGSSYFNKEFIDERYLGKEKYEEMLI